VEATARKAFGENDFDESGLTNMELSSVRLKVRDLTPRIGSEIVTDVETLLSGRESAHIREVLEQRGVVYFRGLEISDAQQVAIAKTLGTIVANEGEEGIYKISLDDKVNQRAKYLKGSLFWHFDGSLQPYPNLATVLHAITLSESGGDTEFCNTYAAYDDLPDTDKELIADLRVVHSAERSQYYVTPEMSHDEILFWQNSPTKACPIVWTHQSGRKSLLLGATADYVVGYSVEESRALLARLRDWATQPQYVYRHEWQVGDLIIWDNTGTMHRALPYAVDSGRLMHRTILAGEEPLQ
jgi:alpha-ketoglutarate-dependent taurine dioxygenase